VQGQDGWSDIAARRTGGSAGKGGKGGGKEGKAGQGNVEGKAWTCKFCRKRDGVTPLVTLGHRLHCFGCGAHKGEVKMADAPVLQGKGGAKGGGPGGGKGQGKGRGEARGRWAKPDEGGGLAKAMAGQQEEQKEERLSELQRLAAFKEHLAKCPEFEAATQIGEKLESRLAVLRKDRDLAKPPVLQARNLGTKLEKKKKQLELANEQLEQGKVQLADAQKKIKEAEERATGLQKDIEDLEKERADVQEKVEEQDKQWNKSLCKAAGGRFKDLPEELLDNVLGKHEQKLKEIHAMQEAYIKLVQEEATAAAEEGKANSKDGGQSEVPADEGNEAKDEVDPDEMAIDLDQQAENILDAMGPFGESAEEQKRKQVAKEKAKRQLQDFSEVVERRAKRTKAGTALG